uniref:Cytochrome c oxidase subunit 3 n=1 Tax=Rhinotergum shaoguanense TaxID=1452699 RepID=A0A1S5XVX6_9ACAR|nr:cytochrome c oxidase subunit III [Rhinotergum shaoguanense]AQQ72850.1 cytochrome oxidase subunit 3 [Rhinotergum shaoguanense]
MISNSHHYFILSFSPWPLISSMNSFNLLLSLLIFLKFNSFICFSLNILNIIVSSFIWWMIYSDEFNLEGKNSFNLDLGLKFSMILFISSEIFFFFSFFWSYFHFFLSPNMEIGLNWPSNMVEAFDCLNVPLINTLVLLSSGMTVTMSHHFLINGKFKLSSFYLMITIFLGVIFTILQLMEYFSSFFSISDSTFGTSFFMLTGFHGIHVLIGTIFLFTTFMKMFSIISSKNDWLSFELASWYWHFVDVVWIFLYFLLYYLNS